MYYEMKIHVIIRNLNFYTYHMVDFISSSTDIFSKPFIRHSILHCSVWPLAASTFCVCVYMCAHTCVGGVVGIAAMCPTMLCKSRRSWDCFILNCSVPNGNLRGWLSSLCSSCSQKNHMSSNCASEFLSDWPQLSLNTATTGSFSVPCYFAHWLWYTSKST
jgi:hypothetical protein